MQLIDALEDRADRVFIEETPDNLRVEYADGWCVYIDGALAPIKKQAFDNLLNLLRIPIKYVERCVEDEGGIWLAQESINFWLERYGKLSFLTERIEGYDIPVITQVFPGKRLYLPGVKVNDLIIEYLGDCDVFSYSIEDDVFNAIYLTGRDEVIAGHNFRVGVRVLYSDCFTITPRFDGVLVDPGGAVLTWPTVGRKFRVASNTVPQIIEQIYEFLDLSMKGLEESVVKALGDFDNSTLVDAEKWITRLCSDLRQNKRLKAELMENCTATPNHLPLELVLNVTSYVASGEASVDLTTAREIQLAISNYIVNGTFK